MKDEVILSPMQKKEIEEAKQKEEMEKKMAFEKDIEAVCEKHNRVLVPFLQFSVSGITPALSSVPKNDKPQSK